MNDPCKEALIRYIQYYYNNHFNTHFLRAYPSYEEQQHPKSKKIKKKMLFTIYIYAMLKFIEFNFGMHYSQMDNVQFFVMLLWAQNFRPHWRSFIEQIIIKSLFSILLLDLCSFLDFVLVIRFFINVFFSFFFQFTDAYDQ